MVRASTNAPIIKAVRYFSRHNVQSREREMRRKRRLKGQVQTGPEGSCGGGGMRNVHHYPRASSLDFCSVTTQAHTADETVSVLLWLWLIVLWPCHTLATAQPQRHCSVPPHLSASVSSLGGLSPQWSRGPALRVGWHGHQLLGIFFFLGGG
jgi:hypothetical protein